MLSLSGPAIVKKNNYNFVVFCDIMVLTALRSLYYPISNDFNLYSPGRNDKATDAGDIFSGLGPK